MPLEVPGSRSEMSRAERPSSIPYSIASVKIAYRAVLSVTEGSIAAPEIGLPMRGLIHGNLSRGTTGDTRIFDGVNDLGGTQKGACWMRCAR